MQNWYLMKLYSLQISCDQYPCMDMVIYTKLVLSIFHSFIIWNILLNSSRVGRRWKFSHRNNGQNNDVLYFPDRLNRCLYAFSTLKEKVSCSSFLTTYMTPLFSPHSLLLSRKCTILSWVWVLTSTKLHHSICFQVDSHTVSQCASLLCLYCTFGNGWASNKEFPILVSLSKCVLLKSDIWSHQTAKFNFAISHITYTLTWISNFYQFLHTYVLLLIQIWLQFPIHFQLTLLACF